MPTASMSATSAVRDTARRSTGTPLTRAACSSKATATSGPYSAFAQHVKQIAGVFDSDELPDAQAKLGKILQAYFDDVVKEGVPDRFSELLKQYDERKDKGSS
jgi:hypothetical protein